MEDNINSGGDCQQTGTIYKITNLVNGKIYVGQTKQQLEKRMNQHKHNSKTDKSGLAAAIRKYGWENFKVEVLEICPVDKLDEREIFWIDELDSMAPKNYNLIKFANGNANPSKETRARISAAKKGANHPMYGKHHSEETKAKMSASRKGKKNGFYGKRHTEETKAKMSAAAKGKKRSQETRSRMSAAHKGKPGTPHTPESKAKLSAASKAYWAKKKALANGGDS